MELLEYEIKSHITTAATLSDQYQKSHDPILNKHVIPRKFYHSILNSGYLTSIDPNLFLDITIYYDLIDAHFNDQINWYYTEIEKIRSEWSTCELVATSSADFDLCDKRKQPLDNTRKQLSQHIITSWVNAGHWIIEHKIDERFNPTQDRLNSPILRLIMGTEALPFLK